MVKIKIAQSYEYLRKYIENIPAEFNTLGTVLESRRNVIREDTVLNTKLVIKSYRRIYLPNRIRYTFFAPSKAQRAFDYGTRLLAQGFITPAPIAYIEITEGGLISESYFVSAFINHEPLNSITDWSAIPADHLVRELAAYTFKLHRNEIYHPDYSMGNILYKHVGNTWEFALVDINRMKFGPVSFKKGIRNMVTLGLPVDQLAPLAGAYGRMWKADEVMSMALFFKFKHIELTRRARKKSLKSMVRGLKSL